jgi:hypothetical protein
MRKQETKRIPVKRGEVEMIAVRGRIEGGKKSLPSREKNDAAEMSVDQGRTAGANGADSRNEAL